jgi:predicted transposase/invertase (TIGR01784 family)
MAVLWLRFLTEIDENTREVPQELLESPEVKQALDIVEQSGYSDAEMERYDKFWDAVRVEQAYIDEAEVRYGMGREEGLAEGEAKGREEGRVEGRAEGLAEGEHNKALESARSMKADGMSAELIAKYTGLTVEQINSL